MSSELWADLAAVCKLNAFLLVLRLWTGSNGEFRRSWVSSATGKIYERIKLTVLPILWVTRNISLSRCWFDYFNTAPHIRIVRPISVHFSVPFQVLLYFTSESCVVFEVPTPLRNRMLFRRISCVWNGRMFSVGSEVHYDLSESSAHRPCRIAQPVHRAEPLLHIVPVCLFTSTINGMEVSDITCGHRGPVNCSPWMLL
jgi:hypothetical protein